MCAGALLLLLAALPLLTGGRDAGPAFAPQQQTAVLARAGASAALRCRVLRLAGRAVSWVRSSDLQILTHAGDVFTADARVSCAEAPGEARDGSDEAGEAHEAREAHEAHGASTVHTLRIERLRAADAGRYECQINTEPKMSLFFNLTVVESSLPLVSVRALGAGARGAVRAAGGAARLACEARYEAPADALAALPPLRVRWSRAGAPLDAGGARGGVSLDTERWPARVVSRLTLTQLTRADAGRYTCGAAGAGGERAAATLLLHLDDDADGELGMQRDQAEARVSAARRVRCAWMLTLTPLTLFLTRLTRLPALT
ncbi:uncharacterized protein LOC112049714 isoform X2 [Bicyclus anynana]|uniref:Uncharacterized protein LOC112049714 isoform X1 n=1 Tax=Bicyclus anynana TaxID=110368 RepID=A0ABM3LTF0_BICAN|nr:uncharacterized protein LOC112049714 isoform X1 [Bicyclus anynana]XP_052742342.1 uncharacterized protein LOC112049714 isoform X2 [Bicyclus anynana]